MVGLKKKEKKEAGGRVIMQKRKEFISELSLLEF